MGVREPAPKGHHRALVSTSTASIDWDLVIFDCDGVLVDSEILSCRCLAEALTDHGLATDLETVLELFLGRSVTAVFEHCRALGRPLPPTFAVDLRQRVRAAFAKSLQPMPAVATAVKRLPARYCLASSSDRERVFFSLEVTGLAELFGDRVYTAQMVARGKPAPDLFLYAAAEMRAEPARTLVIEDSVSGVAAGKAAGMTVWGFVGGSHYTNRDGRRQLKEAGADRVFEQMSELELSRRASDGARSGR
jgi:HAD superfamily hydrolase (TIGR01509 family)